MSSLSFAAANGIKIINASFRYLSSATNGSAPADSSHKQAIENYGNMGGLLICSAGNEGKNTDITPQYPAGYGDSRLFPNVRNVISVGSIDRNGSQSSFSNYGKNSVQIYAPGGDIYSTLPNNSYGYMSGTSMAAPHVTGAAALLLSYDQNLTGEQIKNIILDNAVDIQIQSANAKLLNIGKAMTAIFVSERIGLQNIGYYSNESNGWNIEIKNYKTKDIRVVYNKKMCVESDAKNWSGLKDIGYVEIPAGGTKIVQIQENRTDTFIAISYIENDVRYITYADNLNTNGSCRAMYNTKNVPSYTQHRMKIRNLGKSGDKWLIELTNYTNMHRVFEYNTRMCLENDAERWTNLLHVKKVFIPDGKSLILEISEYSMATCIAISYEERIDRSIIFAYSLSANGTMTCRESRLESVYYSENGMEIAIAGKENNTWVIEVTNVSGSLQTFEYNAKMCFEGDAANWNGLSDIRKVSMDNNIYTRLRITENGTATSIAISYMEGIYRKVIYARDLNAANRTMTVKGNVIDTTVQDSCLAAGSLITLADGSQKAVENLTGDEILLVWNMQTGTVDYAPIWFIDSTTVCTQDIINLHFSDGTSVKVIYEHGFWNCNLNKYVYMDENAYRYIGDWFNKQTVGENGDYVWEKVQLTNVTYTKEYTTAWSPVTYGHLCYFVNGMLSMPGGIDGLFNIFEVDGETMTYDGQAMANDIERYGLYTYEEFSETFDVPEEIFKAVNAKYFKISIGKGLITYADIENLIQRYSKFF